MSFGEYTAASRGLDRIADDHLGVLAQIGQAKRAACHQVIVALRDGGLARAGDKRAALHFRVGDGSHLAGVVGHLADKAEHAVHGRYEIVLVDWPLELPLSSVSVSAQSPGLRAMTSALTVVVLRVLSGCPS